MRKPPELNTYVINLWNNLFFLIHFQAERVATELQTRYDNLTDNVANLETDQVKNKDSLGSLKHHLLEANEVYVKDKDQLVRSKTSIDDRHTTASVRLVS